MNRSLIAIFIAILLILAGSITLGAQGRRFGGGAGFNSTPAVRPGFSAGSPAPVVRPGFSLNPRPPFAVGQPHVPNFGVRPAQPFRPGHPIRPVIAPPVFGFYSPYIWPSTIYDPYASPVYSAPAYSEPAYGYQNPQPPAVSQNEIDLAYQVGQLSAQVDQLRQQQQANAINSYTQPSTQPQDSAHARISIVLVFRDGNTKEIENYAIVGDTLWVLDGGIAAKIAMSDLDLNATQKANGFRFLLPQR